MNRSYLSLVRGWRLQQWPSLRRWGLRI